MRLTIPFPRLPCSPTDLALARLSQPRLYILAAAAARGGGGTRRRRPELSQPRLPCSRTATRAQPAEPRGSAGSTDQTKPQQSRQRAILRAPSFEYAQLTGRPARRPARRTARRPARRPARRTARRRFPASLTPLSPSPPPPPVRAVRPLTGATRPRSRPSASSLGTCQTRPGHRRCRRPRRRPRRRRQ